MKKTIFISLAVAATLIVAWLMLRSTTKTIRPAIDKIETESLSIDKIELTDTAIVLYMDAYNAPEYWVRIDSNSFLKGVQSGQIYKLLRSEGFELNKKITMPETGNISFRLLFEPMFKEETQLDFITFEPDSQSVFSGIWLTEKPRDEKIHCRITGTVNNRPNSSRLMLQRPYDDERMQMPAYIPIRNGRFEYDLYCNEREIYQLVFMDEMQKGSWRPIEFFAEPGEVTFELYPDQNYMKNRISGPELNESFREYQEEEEKATSLNRLSVQLQQLEEEKKYYTPEAKSLIDKIGAAQTEPALFDSLWNEYIKQFGGNNSLTDEAKILQDSLENAFQLRNEWKKTYVSGHPSFVAYYIIHYEIRKKMITGSTEDISDYIRLAKEVYMPANPGHVYTRQIGRMLTTLDSIRVGGRYIDFTAPDLNGQEQRLSTFIDGKIAMIDLWASWCGPCRRRAKKMLPLYEKYKDKGFTVVGIARERDNTSAMKEAIARDGYPWKQLVELNDANGIWELYGVGGGGGRTFLVDRNGTILAVDPSAEEIEQVLKQQL